jgi:hypothetical protein
MKANQGKKAMKGVTPKTTNLIQNSMYMFRCLIKNIFE